MSTKIDFQNAKFLLSVAATHQLPKDVGAEVAFVGRSNAGKSSALNTLTRQHRLAFTSKQPGRTQLINYFTLDETHRLVDLPGYGYAKVPAAIQKNWQQLIENYFQDRKSLKGLILLNDIRHPLKPFDWNMLAFAENYHYPVHILLTKSDKLTRNHANQALSAVEKELREANQIASCQLFSSVSRVGLESLEEKIVEWFLGE